MFGSIIFDQQEKSRKALSVLSLNDRAAVPMPAACGFPLSVVSMLTLHYIPPYLLSVHSYSPASASRAREADSISFHQPLLLFLSHTKQKKS